MLIKRRARVSEKSIVGLGYLWVTFGQFLVEGTLLALFSPGQTRRSAMAAALPGRLGRHVKGMLHSSTPSAQHRSREKHSRGTAKPTPLLALARNFSVCRAPIPCSTELPQHHPRPIESVSRENVKT